VNFSMRILDNFITALISLAAGAGLLTAAFRLSDGRASASQVTQPPEQLHGVLRRMARRGLRLGVGMRGE